MVRLRKPTLERPLTRETLSVRLLVCRGLGPTRGNGGAAHDDTYHRITGVAGRRPGGDGNGQGTRN